MVAFALLTQQPWVRFSAFMKVFLVGVLSEKLIRCSRDLLMALLRGKWTEDWNVNWTHLVLASGQLVLQLVLQKYIFYLQLHFRPTVPKRWRRMSAPVSDVPIFPTVSPPIMQKVRPGWEPGILFSILSHTTIFAHLEERDTAWAYRYYWITAQGCPI